MEEEEGLERWVLDDLDTEREREWTEEDVEGGRVCWALRTDDASCEGKFDGLAPVQILERNVNPMDEILCFERVGLFRSEEQDQEFDGVYLGLLHVV